MAERRRVYNTISKRMILADGALANRLRAEEARTGRVILLDERPITLELRPKIIIPFKGKNLRIRPFELARKKNISRDQARDAINNPDQTRIIINMEGKTIKYKPSESPLLLNPFGVRSNIRNKIYFGDNVTIKDNRIFREVPLDVVMEIVVTFVLYINISGPRYDRREHTDVIKDTVGNMNNRFIESVVEYVDKFGIGNVIIATQENVNLIREENPGVFDQIKFSVLSLQIGGTQPDGNVLITARDINDTDGKRFPLILSETGMHHKNNLRIDNLYTEGIEYTTNDNCVKDYIKYGYRRRGKPSLPEVDNLDDEEGITPKQLMVEIFNKKNIRMYLYDITGKLHLDNKDIVRNPSHHYKALNSISFCEHLYPFKNRVLKPKKHSNLEIEVIPSGINKLAQLLKEGVLPADIKFYKYISNRLYNNPNPKWLDLSYFNQYMFGKKFDRDPEILSFICDGTKYICNDEYLICKKILEKFKLEDKIYDGIKIMKLGQVLEQKYMKENINSYFPNHSKYRKGGFCYTNIMPEGCDEDYITWDKKKSYSHALSNLPFIITMDYRRDTIRKITHEPEKFCDWWIYVAYPEYSSQLLPDNNLYSGRHLSYCRKEGANFNTKEVLESHKIDNPFGPMMDDIYRNLLELFPGRMGLCKDGKIIGEEYAKVICNVWIGKFERNYFNLLRTNTNVTRVGTYTEVNKVDGSKHQLTSKYWMNIKTTNDKNKNGSIYCRKPIAIQIKDQSRRILYQELKDIGISSKDILQIHTDSATFPKLSINKDIDMKSRLGPENDLINGWRIEEFSQLPGDYTYIQNDISLFQDLVEGSKNSTNIDWAGTGKTTKIVKACKNNGGVVIVPTLICKEGYLEKNINCKTLSHYISNNIIPSEDIIYFDEVGMYNKRQNDLVTKCLLLGKEVHIYGDYHQLPPVEPKNKEKKGTYVKGKKYRHFNQPHYFNLFFKDQTYYDKYKFKNWRNNFTCEYYDKLIYGELDIVQEVCKYSTRNPADAEIIICYRNKTVDENNKIMMKCKGFDKITDPGMLLKCITGNMVKDKIYNNGLINVKSVRKERTNYTYIRNPKTGHGVPRRLKVNGRVYKKLAASGVKLDDFCLMVTLSNGKEYPSYDIEGNFMAGYAVGIYGIQSTTKSSYYFPCEDDYFLENNVGYTIISRLRGDVFIQRTKGTIVTKLNINN